MCKKLSDSEIANTYELIKSYHEKYLKLYGVKLPRLKQKGKYTKNALVLVLLAQNYPNTTVLSKAQIEKFMQHYYPPYDMQQARHLAKQDGWYILSGRRNDNNSIDIPNDHYKLDSLEEYYPGFNAERRQELFDGDYWKNLKEKYNYQCACCGSKEGEHHRYNTTVIVKLEKGHMDPKKPLKPGNIIPQCSSCNKADKYKWIYNKEGRVVGIANETAVDNSTEETKKAIYKRLAALYAPKESN